MTWNASDLRPALTKHMIFLLVAYMRKKLSLNARAHVPRRARSPIFGLIIYLLPYLLYARIEGSGETARTRRLV